jgi:hypothetical protein
MHEILLYNYCVNLVRKNQEHISNLSRAVQKCVLPLQLTFISQTQPFLDLHDLHCNKAPFSVLEHLQICCEKMCNGAQTLF